MHHASLFLSPLAGVLNRKPCVDENGALLIRIKRTKTYWHEYDPLLQIFTETQMMYVE